MQLRFRRELSERYATLYCKIEKARTNIAILLSAHPTRPEGCPRPGVVEGLFLTEVIFSVTYCAHAMDVTAAILLEHS